jgi:hypothetical protein
MLDIAGGRSEPRCFVAKAEITSSAIAATPIAAGGKDIRRLPTGERSGHFARVTTWCKTVTPIVVRIIRRRVESERVSIDIKRTPLVSLREREVSNF